MIFCMSLINASLEPDVAEVTMKASNSSELTLDDAGKMIKLLEVLGRGVFGNGTPASRTRTWAGGPFHRPSATTAVRPRLTSSRRHGTALVLPIRGALRGLSSHG